MLFFQYLCSSMLLCSILMQLADPNLLLMSFISMLSATVFLIFRYFINCFCGNQIKIESGRISTSAYFSNWQKLGSDSYKVKKYILLLMHRSQKPTVIAIGKFACLDLQTFLKLMKASFSFFNFIVGSQGK